MQKIGERAHAAGQLSRVGGVVVQRAIARGRVTTPLAVVNGKVNAAVALPPLSHPFQAGLDIAGSADGDFR